MDELPEYGLFEHAEVVAKFVADGQKWLYDHQDNLSKTSATKANRLLIRSRMHYKALIVFAKDSPADTEVVKQLAGQLVSIADKSKLLIAQYITENRNETIGGMNNENTRIVKRRYAKVEQIDDALLHYQTNHKLLNCLYELADRDAKQNRKVPGVKVLIETIVESDV